MNLNLRIGGLATGLDTESIVRDLMRTRRLPVDRMYQQRQLLQWQQEDYRELNRSLRAFRDMVFDMRLQRTYQARSVSSSNEAAVSASAGAGAAAGIYSVSVTQLAQGVYKGSQVALPAGKDGDGSVKTLAAQFGGLPETVSFTLEGSGGSKEFTFNTAQDTISTVVSRINAAGLGITASYDHNQNRFFLSTPTGSESMIKVTEDAAGFLSGPAGDGSNVLGLLLKGDGTEYRGTNAVFNFGDVTGLEGQANTVTVSGVTLNLRQVTAGSVSIAVTSDTGAVFNSIKNFVEKYNDLIDRINGKLAEPRHRDFLPLTDLQKESMSEKEIELWEEKARSGLLRSDSILSGILVKMRSTLGAVLDVDTGGYNSLASIGITTGYYYERGKLYINESKLMEALHNDPDAVMSLFTRSSGTYAEKGLVARLYDDVNEGIRLVANKAGNEGAASLLDNSAIGRRLVSLNKNINIMEERLTGIEERYWRQFTAMERAFQQLNSQSAWLSMQFGGMGQQSF